MKTQYVATHWRRLAGALVFLALTLPVSAGAQSSSMVSGEVTATQRETARGWVLEGRRLFAEKDYAAALERHMAAYRLVRAPTIGMEVARTQEAMGKWAEANATAVEVINLPAAADEPTVFADAREHARELLNRLMILVPALRIDVTPANLVVRVEIDGEPMTMPGQELSFRLNPGGHEVLVSAPGYFAARRTVALRQKERQTLALTLVPETVQAAHGPTRDELFSDANPAAPAPDKSRTPSTLGYVALGTAGVATLLGGITGTLAFTSKPNCPGGRCRADQRDEADESLLYGNIATVSFGVAIAAGAYGLWHLLSDDSQRAPSETLTRTRVTPVASGAMLELSGSF